MGITANLPSILPAAGSKTSGTASGKLLPFEADVPADDFARLLGARLRPAAAGEIDPSPLLVGNASIAVMPLIASTDNTAGDIASGATGFQPGVVPEEVTVTISGTREFTAEPAPHMQDADPAIQETESLSENANVFAAAASALGAIATPAAGNKPPSGQDAIPSTTEGRASTPNFPGTAFPRPGDVVTPSINVQANTPVRDTPVSSQMLQTGKAVPQGAVPGNPPALDSAADTTQPTANQPTATQLAAFPPAASSGSTAHKTNPQLPAGGKASPATSAAASAGSNDMALTDKHTRPASNLPPAVPKASGPTEAVTSPPQMRPQPPAATTGTDAAPALAPLRAEHAPSTPPSAEQGESAKLAGAPAGPAIPSAPPVAGTTPQSISSGDDNQISLPTHLHDPRWSQHLGERIVMLTRGESTSAQININPAQLGPIRVDIDLQGDRMTVHFASASPEVRQSLEDSLPRLREMLAGSGIQLGQANVGSHSQQTPREAYAQNMASPRSGGEGAILPGERPQDTTSPGRLIHGGDGLVDLFA